MQARKYVQMSDDCTLELEKVQIDFLVSLQKHYFDIDCKNWESVGNKMVSDRIAQLRAV